MSNTFYKAGSRYNAIHISRVMIDIVNAAYDQELIGTQQITYDIEESKNREITENNNG